MGDMNNLLAVPAGQEVQHGEPNMAAPLVLRTQATSCRATQDRKLSKWMEYSCSSRLFAQVGMEEAGFQVIEQLRCQHSTTLYQSGQVIEVGETVGRVRMVSQNHSIQL
jgi:hypothetical protein